MHKIRHIFSIVALALMMLFSSAASAGPGFVALEGSDSTALHQDPQYTPQLFSYLQGASTKNVLVLGGVTLQHVGSVGVTYVSSLTGQTLSDFSALYIESPGGCCTADNSALNGFGSAVNAFITSGGNLSIENYVGGGYDGVVVGGASAPMGSILGAGTSGGGSSCTDGELVTALGIAKGFSQPPVDGCWEHQAYQMSYWGALGYQNLIASDPGGYTFGDESHVGSAFLALGGTLGSPTPTVPEPATWLTMLFGFAMIAFAVRTAARRSDAAFTVKIAKIANGAA
jgi:hypothetical protein